MAGEEDAVTQRIAVAAIDWRPEMADALWADVSHWHPLVNADAYATANKVGLIGIKVADCGLAARLGAEQCAAAEARGLIVVGYQYGCTHPEQFIELWPSKPGRIRCFDFEGLTANLKNVEHCIAVAEQADGRLPWIYFGGEEWRRCGQPAGTAVARCPSWQSQYGPHLRPLPNVGPLVAWQARGGSTAGPAGMPMSHPGVGEGPCDLSVLLITVEELWKMAGALEPDQPGT